MKRIANLLTLGGAGEGYDVPASAIGEGFESAVFETAVPNAFLNDLDRSFMDTVYSEAGLRAQEAGYDAVFINTVGDYGIVPLRAALEIPVVGAGQAGMQLATSLAERFAIVTVWPEATRSLYERTLARNGFTDRCVGVRYVTGNAELPEMDGEEGIVEEMRSGHEAILARIAAEAEALVRDGADVIMLGCTCMSPIQAELGERIGRPVIDPLAAGHKFAEMLLTLGLRQPAPATQPLNADLIRSMVVAAGEAAGAAPLDEACGDTCSIFRASAAEQVGV